MRSTSMSSLSSFHEIDIITQNATINPDKGKRKHKKNFYFTIFSFVFLFILLRLFIFRILKDN